MVGTEAVSVAVPSGSQRALGKSRAGKVDQNHSQIRLSVNGTQRDLVLDNRTTLLDALREHMHLTGTKKGCDHGQCGACTVFVEGRRINACLTLAVMHDGDEITTIEGLGQPGNLHPMQAAFIKHDGFQCAIARRARSVPPLRCLMKSRRTFQAMPQRT